MSKEDRIKKIVEDFLEKTTFDVEEVDVSYEEDGKTIWCRVKSSEPNFFIGKDGEIIGSLNHLIKKIIEKETGRAAGDDRKEHEANIVVDINDHQKKKIENLKSIAHMMAERAKFFKSSIEVDPMSSYERRIIHEFLASRPNIRTESTGEGRMRRVVIKYTGC